MLPNTGDGLHPAHHLFKTARHPNVVFEVLWDMKKNGYSEHTIKNVGKALNRIQSGCDLANPDDVKGFIAKLDTARRAR
jgi:hypothetical protein